MGDVKPTEQMKKVSLPDKKKQPNTPYHLCAMHILTMANGVGGSLLLPEARGGCVRRRQPTQSLGEELCEGRGSGPGSRRGSSACACGMVGAALAHWGTHTQLHQQAKELSEGPTKSR